jgi:hypothetical protein
MSGIAQPGEEAAGLLELAGARALGEIARDDHQIGLLLVDPFLERANQYRLVCAEMKVGQVKQARHDALTRVTLNLFPGAC